MSVASGAISSCSTRGGSMSPPRTTACCLSRLASSTMCPNFPCGSPQNSNASGVGAALTDKPHGQVPLGCPKGGQRHKVRRKCLIFKRAGSHTAVDFSSDGKSANNPHDVKTTLSSAAKPTRCLQREPQATTPLSQAIPSKLKSPCNQGLSLKRRLKRTR